MNLITLRAADYDPFSNEVMANPLPFYEEPRARGPIRFLPPYDSFALDRIGRSLVTLDGQKVVRGREPAHV